MIYVKDYEDLLNRIGAGYFIHDINFVDDITSWARKNNRELGEPHHPMKLIPSDEDFLSMVIQSDIHEEVVDDVIKNLSIRWSVKDNATDMDRKLNSTKKRLIFCFLKERARTMKDVGGNELAEDEWVFDEMQLLGYFDEYVEE